MTAAIRASSVSRVRPSRVALSVVGSRVVLSLAAILGSGSRVAGTNEGVGGIGPSWMVAWTSYDANWYVSIARSGYDQAPTTAFFPLLPTLMRLLAPLVGFLTGTDDDVATAISGIAISTLAFVLALVMIHRETAAAQGRTIADRTAVVLAFLPFALTWQAVYTESLALLLLAVLWGALKRQRVVTAVIAATALGTTRSIGIPIGLGLLAVHLGLPLLRRRRPVWNGELLAGAAALLASGAVLVWLGQIGGGIGAQAQFGRSRSWPWVPIWHDLTGVGGYQLGSITSLFAIGVGAAFICARHEPLEWRISIAVMLLMHLTMARQFPAFTIGAARYLMPMYPVAGWLARRSLRLSRPVLVGVCVVGVSTAVLCAYSAGQGTFNVG